MGDGAAKALGYDHEMAWGRESRQTEKLRGTPAGKHESKRLKGAEEKNSPGVVSKDIFSHVIFPRCKETFLCEGRGRQQRCFPLPLFPLSKDRSLPGTAFSAPHCHQGEATTRGATDLNEAMVY